MAPPMPRGLGQQLAQELAQHIATMGYATEIIYSFVIIACSLMIYFGTKELYELSSYKGIKYFRYAFLFFAIAYFFRSIIKFFIIAFDVHTLIELAGIINGIFSPIALFIFIYFSSMAIFYLLYSVMCKKWEKRINYIYIFNVAAIIISLITILSGSPWIILGIHLFLFLFIAFVVVALYIESREKGKKHGMYGVYVLLFIFWILNILDILVPDFFQVYKLIIYIASILIFLSILYKVLKKAG